MVERDGSASFKSSIYPASVISASRSILVKWDKGVFFVVDVAGNAAAHRFSYTPYREVFYCEIGLGDLRYCGALEGFPKACVGHFDEVFALYFF